MLKWALLSAQSLSPAINVKELVECASLLSSWWNECIRPSVEMIRRKNCGERADWES